jgi:hypothetical protein
VFSESFFFYAVEVGDFAGQAGADGHVLRLQRFGQRSAAGVGPLQQPQQDAKDHDAVEAVGQQSRLDQARRCRPSRQLLLLAALRIGGGVDGVPGQREAGNGSLAEQQAEVIVDAGMHLVLQLLAGLPVRRLIDNEAQGERQVAVAGEADAAEGPQATGVETRRAGKGEEGRVVVDAAITAERAQKPL